LISLERVSFAYDGRETLRDITLSLEPGSFHFLTGPSGAGKTTLLRLLYLDSLPQSGTIQLFGKDPSKLDRRGLTKLRRRIGIVFQDFRLLDHMTVRENINLPLRVCGQSVRENKRNVSDLIKWVGLIERADAFPPQLSAGEKQRAAIARAVIISPDIVLADEPTGNVDPEMGARILRLLVELNRFGKTVVVATHDLGLIRSAKGEVSARLMRLADKTISQSGVDI